MLDPDAYLQAYIFLRMIVGLYRRLLGCRQILRRRWNSRKRLLSRDSDAEMFTAKHLKR